MKIRVGNAARLRRNHRISITHLGVVNQRRIHYCSGFGSNNGFEYFGMLENLFAKEKKVLGDIMEIM